MRNVDSVILLEHACFDEEDTAVPSNTVLQGSDAARKQHQKVLDV